MKEFLNDEVARAHEEDKKEAAMKKKEGADTEEQTESTLRFKGGQVVLTSINETLCEYIF